MSQAATTTEGAVPSGSLREAIEIKRVRGETFNMRDAVAIVVPLCTHLHQNHAGGRRFLVYPSVLVHGKAGTELDFDGAKQPPTHQRDRAAIAPECRKGQPGDDRASVFSIGAILYELVTGEVVGPGMRRPTEINPNLPPALEVVLGKALVGDPKHRPHDLAALAQALHHLSPAGSMPPPPADESHLDHEEGFDVDVSLSMLPPAPSGPVVVQASNGIPPSQGRPVARAVPAAELESADPTVRLAAMKARLEADPRPRYVVVKDGMDHGPFNAVELLQQIASHSFVSEHVLRDTLSGDEKKIADWPDFTLFAHQAHLNREVKAERKALEKVVSSERQRAQWKVLTGVTLLGLVVAGGAGYWLRERARSENEQKLRAEQATNVDADAALSGGKSDAKPGGAGGPWTGGGGGKHPVVAGGGSCEAARAKYVEDYSQQGVPPDLSAGAYAGTLNNGAYLNSCGVPSNMGVSICAAIQNGRAVGVTVRTTPSNPGIESCVKGQIMAKSFPSHPRLDVTTTTFAAQ
jgi:hypothetical protein